MRIMLIGLLICLLNCAGMLSFKSPVDTSPSEWYANGLYLVTISLQHNTCNLRNGDDVLTRTWKIYYLDGEYKLDTGNPIPLIGIWEDKILKFGTRAKVYEADVDYVAHFTFDEKITEGVLRITPIVNWSSCTMSHNIRMTYLAPVTVGSVR